MDSQEFAGETHWSQTFRNHALGLERYLADHSRGGRMPGEQTMYLAGMIAREMDRAYLAQIQEYLVEDPLDMDQAVLRHAPYLGQNAPLVTLSRINAEHLTLQIAATAGGGQASRIFHLMIPARYFRIAAYYSLQSGNPNQARIFDFLCNHLSVVVEIIAGYIEDLEARGWKLDVDPAALADSDAWRRFATDTNETNRRKEFWDAAGIRANKKNRISGMEFRSMIDYTNTN